MSKLDLYNNKYDYNTLKKHIYQVSMVDVLKTQILTPPFCVKYILNSRYQLTPEEKELTIEDVLKYQPHINHFDLKRAILTFDSDYDSFDEFDTYIEKTDCS
jgi:hypothetical protein